MNFLFSEKTITDFLPHASRLEKGSNWLIRLRWIAIAGVFLATLSSGIFQLRLQYLPLHFLTTCLIIENILLLIILRYIRKKGSLNNIFLLKLIINFQILFDLFFLVVIMHFTGGIENPFYLFCLFHMVIASVLLSKINSYLIVSYALLLLCFQTYFEYNGVFAHYPLCQYYEMWKSDHLASDLYKNKYFIIETLAVFIFTSYLLVYMANSVVSLLRRQETALQNANDKLQENDKIKNEYVLRLTHDIKGHITAIQTNLTLFTGKILGTLNEKQSEFIESTYNRSVKLSDFVNKLLSLTYMRMNNSIELETFLIHDAVSNAINSVSGIAESKSIAFYHMIDPGLHKITNNQFSFEELISSILMNAIKYTPPSGKIDLLIKDKNDEILIEVSDTGIGIPEMELSKIFDEFYRASNAKKSIKDGSGLGLAMVHQIVKLYGGKIWVDSTENHGTSFFVSFPKDITEKKSTAFAKSLKVEKKS